MFWVYGCFLLDGVCDFVSVYFVVLAVWGILYCLNC